MTTDAAPSVHELGRSLVRTSVRLFLASLLVAALLLPAGGRLNNALDAGATDQDILAVALTPVHLALLSPLLARRLLGARARGLLPAESILVFTDVAATWWLFAQATVVTAAALAVHVWWSPPSDSFERVLMSALASALWLYRVIVVNVRWFRHARSLGDTVGVLSRATSGYRGPPRFFLQAAEARREVVLERVDGVSLTLKYVDAARLAAQSGAPATAEIDGVQEVWRAAGPRGAQVVAAWLGRS